MNNDSCAAGRLVALVFIVSFLTVASCVSYQNRVDDNAMLEMVKAGASPFSARCAVRTGNDEVCRIEANKR